MERLSKIAPLKNEAAHLTTFDNGRHEASLDAVYVKNLNVSQITTSNNPLSDHRYVTAEFNLIIAEQPETMFTKTTIQKCWSNPKTVKAILTTAFPLIPAADIIGTPDNLTTIVTGLRTFDDIYTKSAAEITDILRTRKFKRDITRDIELELIEATRD